MYVLAKHMHTTRPVKKLSEKLVGPFEVLAKVGKQSYSVRLPDTMRGKHPVFHVSQLEPGTPNTIPSHVQLPPPPVIIDDEPEYKISEVLDAKIDRRRKCKLLYLVRWSGYEGTDEETSWIPADELPHASELLSDFHAAYPAKPGPLSSIP